MPDGLRIYENTRALPQAYFTTEALATTSVATAVQSLKDGRLDWHRSVLLEGLTKKDTNGNSANIRVGIVPIAVQRPNTSRVELEFSFDKPGYVVLTDTYFPGWHAYIDNSEVQIYRANILFRAVKVAPGQHVLKFKYRPFSIMLGCFVCSLALFFCTLVLLRERRAAS
jgi:hypothetical protein